MTRQRKSQNVHTISCLHREPGVTICCCWLDIENNPNAPEQVEKMTYCPICHELVKGHHAHYADDMLDPEGRSMRLAAPINA